MGRNTQARGRTEPSEGRDRLPVLTPTTCVICGEASEQGFACAVCERRLRDRLANIVEFYALAEGELVPGASGGSRSSSERSLGVRVAALDFLAGNDVVAILGLWERDWRETYDLSDAKAGRDVQDTLTAIVNFLLAWLHRSCTDHPAIDDFAREVRECWGIARAAARMAPARRTLVDCPTIDEDDQACTGKIGIDDRDETHCRTCGATRTLDLLLAITGADDAAPVWVDAEVVVRKTGVPERTLRHWAGRGKVSRSHGRYELRSVYSYIESGRVVKGA